jgi:hypothetical protein
VPESQHLTLAEVAERMDIDAPTAEDVEPHARNTPQVGGSAGAEAEP